MFLVLKHDLAASLMASLPKYKPLEADCQNYVNNLIGRIAVTTPQYLDDNAVLQQLGRKPRGLP